MWTLLSDETLLEDYKKGFLPDEFPEAVFELLKKLTLKHDATKLSAFTSLGQLYLTTAYSWNEKEKNYAVSINQRIDAGKTVIVIASNIEGGKKSVISHQCSIDEAVEYVDLRMISILLKKYGEL